jgi:hypothetical protein
VAGSARARHFADAGIAGRAHCAGGLVCWLVETCHRLDLLVENPVIVEIKSVERYDPVFEAQVLTYFKVTEKRDGLLINFNNRLLKDGVKRFIL